MKELLGSVMVGILMTIAYWYILFHTSWAHSVAIFSIVFFGISVFMHLLSAILGMITLCATGTIALLSCPVGGPVSCIVVVLVGALVAFLVAFQFGVAIWGLIISINLLNSGAQTCSASYAFGVNCTMLVVLFAVTWFTGALKSKKVEPQTMRQPVVEGDHPPEYTNLDGSRAFVNTFLFNPRSASNYQYPTPTAPPAYYP
uniref:Uncharacterized protein n=1 Tax=Ditylenchus dipsaci TaxID=166011 RepID=A0A915D5C8_9BILA